MTERFTSSFGLSAELEEAMRAMGPVLNPQVIEGTRDLFAAGKDRSLPAGGARHADLTYGDHPRQTLDLCTPGVEGLPIVLFIPGGGFTGGDKAFYDHIPYFFARSGFVGAGMNYRLAPDFQWPSGAQDIAAALDWLAGNAAQFGGDPSRIFVIGQSAGAVHLAGTLFDKRMRPACHAAIRGAALLSGLYDIAPGIVETVPLYFGADESLYADRSSARHVAGTTMPVLLTLAELDPPFFAGQAAAMLKALTERDGIAPQFAWLRGHNHLSPVLGMGAPGDELGAAILAEFRRYDHGPAGPL